MPEVLPTQNIIIMKESVDFFARWGEPAFSPGRTLLKGLLVCIVILSSATAQVVNTDNIECELHKKGTAWIEPGETVQGNPVIPEEMEPWVRNTR